MPFEISEARFEQDIVATLAGDEADAGTAARDRVAAPPRPQYGEGEPGGYARRRPEQYDRSLCLIPEDLVAFIQATQPKTWERLRKQHGSDTRDEVVRRVAREVGKRGLVTCLRDGIKLTGQRIRLAHVRPVSGLNEELRTLYEGNIFSVVRQLRYSERNENSIDLVLFLNGLPFFTAELKTPLTGQTVINAIAQFRRDRDPSELLFDARRCLAHFAVDPELVYVATRLQGAKTRFLPFNQGRFGGAGNPPVQAGYATAYLWERVWARDSVLNLIQHFIHEVDQEDDRGRSTGRKSLVFPRYHQLDAVRRLIQHARENGAGQRYLIQHSAGSGKSMSIAWLAHQLSSLHDADDRRVFDSIVVVTDRRVLDRQLQKTVQSFEKTLGVVAMIREGSAQLREALEAGKNIIVTTLQKFPFIVQKMGELPGRRFAVIVDEAHSSQSGEMTKSLKQVLATDSLQDAEATDDLPDVEDQLVAEMKARGPQRNVSTFAFTATPKEKTLELFGSRDARGRYAPFSLYSMRQAIEEGFILDVLENYTTYQTYWKLLKTATDDPTYERDKASRLLKAFVELHEHAIAEKVRIMAEHFRQHVAHRVDGRAKAMIVTRSRLHCVRYHRALQRYLKEQSCDYGALVAFSGTVRDHGLDYTEPQINGLPETQTRDAFERAENRFLVVANKFQTGFDQPLLHTMYVDKKLGGVNAVQTLSRLNRTHPGKEDTMVLDFGNDADAIRGAFEPYYEHTILSEGTDPNLLHDLENRIEDYGLFGSEQMDAFAAVYFRLRPQDDQSALYAILDPVKQRYIEHLDEESQAALRSDLDEFVRLYGFLSQILTFQDHELERLYLFSRYLKRVLPVEHEALPKEIQEQIDIESYGIRRTFDGKVDLDRGKGEIDPRTAKDPVAAEESARERLSAIIRELNDRFGAGLTEEDRRSLEHLEDRLTDDPALQAAARSNTRENVRLTFEHKVRDELQDMATSNFQLYKRISDDREFGRALLDFLFEDFWKGREPVDPPATDAG